MLDDLVQYATLLGVFLTAVGVGCGVYVYRRQMNAQLLLEFTGRYDEVMRSFPEDSRTLRLDISGELPPESDDLRIAVLRYLNLCSEEYYLFTNKYLAKGILRIWENELKRTLRSPLVRREWIALEKEFSEYGEFHEYVKQAQRGE
jgi:hypothetical protein